MIRKWGLLINVVTLLVLAVATLLLAIKVGQLDTLLGHDGFLCR